MKTQHQPGDPQVSLHTKVGYRDMGTYAAAAATPHTVSEMVGLDSVFCFMPDRSDPTHTLMHVNRSLSGGPTPSIAGRSGSQKTGVILARFDKLRSINSHSRHCFTWNVWATQGSTVAPSSSTSFIGECHQARHFNNWKYISR
jgi:hypothetical protein